MHYSHIYITIKALNINTYIAILLANSSAFKTLQINSLNLVIPFGWKSKSLYEFGVIC